MPKQEKLTGTLLKNNLFDGQTRDIGMMAHILLTKVYYSSKELVVGVRRRSKILRKILILLRKSYLFIVRASRIPFRLLDKFKAQTYLNSPKARRILNESKTLQEFWEESHLEQSRRWITGSSPKDELGYLDFSTSPVAIHKILVVGVGTGATANHLSNLGYEVSVLDITDLSFNLLDQNIKGRYLVANYEELPLGYFSFILHHLVAQHMSDEDLRLQIDVLFNSLSDGGLLKLQFASSLIDGSNDIKSSEMDQKLGRVLRSVGRMESMVPRKAIANSTVSKKLDFPEWEEGWCWYLLQVRK